MRIIVAFAFMAGFPALAKEYKSSHIKNFDMRQCQSGTDRCFEAQGPIAFVSMNGRMISAGGISLVFKEGATEEKFHCASFNYNVSNQTLHCEGEKSVFIDAGFKLRKI